MKNLTSNQLVISAHTSCDIAIRSLQEGNSEFAVAVLKRLKDQLDNYLGNSDPRSNGVED